MKAILTKEVMTRPISSRENHTFTKYKILGVTVFKYLKIVISKNA